MTMATLDPELIRINIPAGSQKNYGIVVDDQDGVYNDVDDGIDSADRIRDYCTDAGTPGCCFGLDRITRACRTRVRA